MNAISLLAPTLVKYERDRPFSAGDEEPLR